MTIISKNITLASELLKAGKLVAIPTETVYGLAANAFNAEAVAKIFEAKNRPFFDPLICHVSSLEKAKSIVCQIPDKALQLAETFWPGPMTLLLPKKKEIPDIVTSGLETVGVRIPNHPLTNQLLEMIDFPLAAPSANPFGYVSPTTAIHVYDQLKENIDLILDGGSCQVGLESTIIGFENDEVIIHRVGGLSIEDIENVIGKVKISINSSSNPVAPGQLKSHYAPLKPLFTGNVNELLEQYKNKKIGIISFYLTYVNVHKQIQLSLNKSLNEAATNLFSAIRVLDQSDVDIILAEIFPDEGLGRAINDRLRRASVG